MPAALHNHHQQNAPAAASRGQCGCWFRHTDLARQPPGDLPALTLRDCLSYC